MNRDDIQRKLLTGHTITDGLEMDYDIRDVREECRDLDDLLIEVSTTDNPEKVFSDIRMELYLAAGRLADDIVDSFED